VTDCLSRHHRRRGCHFHRRGGVGFGGAHPGAGTPPGPGLLPV